MKSFINNYLRYIILALTLIFSICTNNYVIFLVLVIESIISVIISRYGIQKAGLVYIISFIIVIVIGSFLGESINKLEGAKILLLSPIMLLLAMFVYFFELIIRGFIIVTPGLYKFIKEEMKKASTKKKIAYIAVLTFTVIVIFNVLVAFSPLYNGIYYLYNELVGKTVETFTK